MTQSSKPKSLTLSYPKHPEAQNPNPKSVQSTAKETYWTQGAFDAVVGSLQLKLSEPCRTLGPNERVLLCLIGGQERDPGVERDCKGIMGGPHRSDIEVTSM